MRKIIFILILLLVLAALDLVLVFQKGFGGAMQKVQAAQPKDTDVTAVICG